MGDEEARRFAGAARYRTEFTVPDRQADEWILDLGDVRESARVRVNGRSAATRFSLPFKMPIGKYVQPGRNLLEISLQERPNGLEGGVTVEDVEIIVEYGLYPATLSP